MLSLMISSPCSAEQACGTPADRSTGSPLSCSPSQGAELLGSTTAAAAAAVETLEGTQMLAQLNQH